MDTVIGLVGIANPDAGHKRFYSTKKKKKRKKTVIVCKFTLSLNNIDYRLL